MTKTTDALPFAAGRDETMLPEGTDIWVTQFIITVLPRLQPGKPRPSTRDASRTLVMIADRDVPEGSTALREAVALAHATCPPGMTVSVAPGQRMQRRVAGDGPDVDGPIS